MEVHSPTTAASGPQSSIAVTVLNETDVDIDVAVWTRLISAVLEAEGVRGPAETNAIFVTRAAMADLNREHMGVDGPTDVLSFPIDDEPSGDADRSNAEQSLRLVGDIVICPEIAAENAPGHAGSINDEIALLSVHAALHLLGHDHAEADERAVMWAAEQRLMGSLWGEVAETAWSDS